MFDSVKLPHELYRRIDGIPLSNPGHSWLSGTGGIGTRSENFLASGLR